MLLLLLGPIHSAVLSISSFSPVLCVFIFSFSERPNLGLYLNSSLVITNSYCSKLLSQNCPWTLDKVWTQNAPVSPCIKGLLSRIWAFVECLDLKNPDLIDGRITPWWMHNTVTERSCKVGNEVQGSSCNGERDHWAHPLGVISCLPVLFTSSMALAFLCQGSSS